MIIRYGILSDIHRIPLPAVEIARKILVERGADKLILNGDIGDEQGTLKASQDHLGSVLTTIGESGLETFVQPGSHETAAVFGSVVDFFSNMYPMIDTIRVQKVEQEDHDLVFLPDLDFLFDEEDYLIGSDKGPRQGAMQHSNLQELRHLVTDPNKTIVVCHVPRRFDSIEHGVDVAYFAERSDGSVYPGVQVEEAIRQQNRGVSPEQIKIDNDVDVAYFAEGSNGSTIPTLSLEDTLKRQFGIVSPEEIDEIARRNDLTLKRENRGNEELRDLYNELGINKAISSHFHESVGRAHDLNCNPLPQGQPTEELFWNPSCLDSGDFGILTVEDNKVAYENLLLDKHLATSSHL